MPKTPSRWSRRCSLRAHLAHFAFCWVLTGSLLGTVLAASEPAEFVKGGTNEAQGRGTCEAGRHEQEGRATRARTCARTGARQGTARICR